MKSYSRLILTAGVAFLLVALWPLHAAGADSMLYLEYRLLLPKADADSFLAKPRKMWRVGKTKLRLEEPPDPEKNIHPLLITNFPETWMVNRTTKIGNHVKDPAKTRGVTIPIFPPVGPAWLNELEFGGEMSFFKKYQAEVKLKENIQGKMMDRYRIQKDGVDLLLFVRSDKQTPVRVMLRAGDRILGIDYDVYRPKLKPDETLFRPPPGIKWEEVQPKTQPKG